MTGAVDALSALCALGGVALAAAPDRRAWRALAVVSAGFVVGIWRIGSTLPTLESVGLIVAAASFIRLVTRRGVLAAAFIGGWLAAVWSSILQIEGVPSAAAIVLAATPVLAAAWLASERPGFAPERVRDEALLLTLCGAVVVAIVPGLAEGWRSAVALNILDTTDTAVAVPAWTLTLTLGAIALGGICSLWRRG